MKKNCVFKFLVIGMVILVATSCEKRDEVSLEVMNNGTLGSTEKLLSNVTDEVISINITDHTAQVNNALAIKQSLTIEEVFVKNQILISGARSTRTDLPVVLDKFMFGSNEQKGTRRPQGVANFGNYVINSWYFTDNSDWDGNCKLTVTDLSRKSYFNLVPVQFHDTQVNKFKHIDSHAGGLTVVDHYLYIASGKSILIFDLNKIYPITSKPDPTIATDQNFIYEYTYMIPQVGYMSFETASQANASYISLTEINSKQYFVVGNFYSRTADYDNGGKSMIWLLPVIQNLYSFPVIEVNSETNQYMQIEPLFPSGDEKNKTVTRIQGVVIKDNVLILNRSYTDHETFQLIVMKYSDILAENPTLLSFFSGTKSNKQSYNNKNWMVGCEDLEFYNNRIWTITEFVAFNSTTGYFENRSLYSASYSDIIDLLAPVQ